MQHFYMKLIQVSECLVCIVGTDGLVLQHQGISKHSVKCVPTHFQLFNGLFIVA